MIDITLNGEPRQLAEGTSLSELIAALGHTPQSLSSAINGEFVARDARPQRVLCQCDAVFTFQPITGG